MATNQQTQIPSWVQAIPYIGSVLGPLASLFGLGGNGNSSADTVKAYQELLLNVPELRRSLQLQVTQAERNDPLHQAVVQLATNYLPKSAFMGGTGPYAGRPVAAAAPPPQSQRDYAVSQLTDVPDNLRNTPGLSGTGRDAVDKLANKIQAQLMTPEQRQQYLRDYVARLGGVHSRIADLLRAKVAGQLDPTQGA